MKWSVFLLFDHKLRTTPEYVMHACDLHCMIFCMHQACETEKLININPQNFHTISIILFCNNEGPQIAFESHILFSKIPFDVHGEVRVKGQGIYDKLHLPSLVMITLLKIGESTCLEFPVLRAYAQFLNEIYTYVNFI